MERHTPWDGFLSTVDRDNPYHTSNSGWSGLLGMTKEEPPYIGEGEIYSKEIIDDYNHSGASIVYERSYPAGILLAFCEQTKSQKLPKNIPGLEMLEIVMARTYERENGTEKTFHTGSTSHSFSKHFIANAHSNHGYYKLRTVAQQRYKIDPL
ncbi:hypothetical protein MUK42_12243 [Musa troglodytarum]|uniref:Uncharacterized protein n=1 Tax=Musa troglodytarum TaxID=320322 RepID=A0A9E7GKJ7_9LILI|nr:hypothetical protein MUK42_12243 [Musa troglodytarum]